LVRVKTLMEFVDSVSVSSLQTLFLHPLDIFFDDFGDRQFIGAPGHAFAAISATLRPFPHGRKNRIFHCAGPESYYEGTGAHDKLDGDFLWTREAVIATAAEFFIIFPANPLDSLKIFRV
jgi:hypothetical protein